MHVNHDHHNVQEPNDQRSTTEILRDLTIAFLIGGMAFLAVTGGRILWPSNIDWLMVGDDGATHYIGWEFYRNAPLLQWPFGANPDYGQAISSSIVFSDSIPLFAMVLKPFSDILPRPFQYFGIWILVCMVLQVYFARRLLSNLGMTPLQSSIASVFFVIAPIFLFRILLSHYAGSGHWIVLAALALYFDRNRNTWSWPLLLCVASLSNIYLAVMAGAIFGADLIQRHWSRQQSTTDAILQCIVSVSFALLTMHSAGYFMAGKYTADQGYGYYRLNLLAPFLPMGGWSAWLPSPLVSAGDFEGFSYLGTGVFGLLMLGGIVSCLIGRVEAKPSTFVPITGLMLAFMLFAISNRIAAGSLEILSFELPSRLWPICSSFRSSGRFFMPVYYLLIAVSAAVVSRSTKATTGCVAICGLLCVQLVDIHGGIRQLQVKLQNANRWSTPLKSDFWADCSQRYTSLLVIKPAKHFDGYLPLAAFAQANKMATNAVYLARVDQEKLRSTSMEISKVVESGAFSDDTVYIFSDRDQWQATIERFGDDVVGKDTDGYLVLVTSGSRHAKLMGGVEEMSGVP